MLGMFFHAGHVAAGRPKADGRALQFIPLADWWRLSAHARHVLRRVEVRDEPAASLAARLRRAEQLGDPLGEVLPLPAGAAVVREARTFVEEQEEDGGNREEGEDTEDGEDRGGEYSSSCGQRRRKAGARAGAKL